jgi:RNA polymerase sigma factor (TIGR02999 family)
LHGYQFEKSQTIVSHHLLLVEWACIIGPIGTEAQPPITQLLSQLRAGDESARGELMEVVYTTLHQIAKSQLRKERPDHTLQPTALVNEAYLKIFGHSTIDFVDRAHFFAIVSQAMRRILVDHARARATARRNGARISLNTEAEAKADKGSGQMSLLDLDLAMEALAREKTSLAQLIEMRYFGGMSAEETAEVLGRSVHVVRHDLRLAHAWLRRELAGRG